MHRQLCRVSVINEVSDLAAGLGFAGHNGPKLGANAVGHLRQFLHARGREPGLRARAVRVLPVRREQQQKVPFPAQLGADALHFVRLEALDPARVLFGRVAVTPQDGQHNPADVMARLAVPGRLLDFGVNAHHAAAGLVEPLDELQFLLQRRNLERRLACRKAVRIDGLAGLGVDAFIGAQLLDLREREIQRVVMAVGPFAIGEPLGDVADGLQLGVVHHDGHVILREHHILFQEVRAHRVGQHLGRDRVLGQVAAGAAMRDNGRLGRLGNHRQGQGAQEGNEQVFHHDL